MTTMNGTKVVTSDAAKLRTDDGRGRLYSWGDEVFRSVTTILKALSKDALIYWAAREVAEYAYDERDDWAGLDRAKAVRLLKGAPWDKRDAAGNLGTAVHDAIEALVLGQTAPEYAPAIAARMDGFDRFVKDYRPEWLASEAAVFSRKYGYAGTLDGIVGIGDKTYIIDAKTGKGVYPEYALQLAAYANAEFVGLPDGSEGALPAIDGGLVLHLTPTGYKVVRVRIDDEVFRYFLYVLQMHKWQEDVSGTAILDALPVPTKALVENVADEFGATVEV
jgi:hypothetical protein